MSDDSITPAFEPMTLIACRMMGREYDDLVDYFSSDTHGISCPLNDVEGMLHEICHYAVAPELRRRQPNYGLDEYYPRSGYYAEERMCGWVEDYLYGKAGVTRPRSSVDDSDYRDHPDEQPEALRRWRSFVTRGQERAIVDALQMPGGRVGKWW